MQLLRSSVRNGLEAAVVLEDGTTVRGKLQEVEWCRGVAIFPYAYDSFGTVRGLDAEDILEDLSQPGQVQPALKRLGRRDGRALGEPRPRAAPRLPGG